MKKFFKFVGIFIILVIVAFAAAMYFTSSATTPVDNFFKSVKAGNYNEAQRYLSAEFKRNTSLAQLKKVFPYSKFKHYQDCSFLTREVNANGTGKLKGKIEFSDGSFIPVKVFLVKENGKWKINAIFVEKAGIINSSSIAQSRSPKELARETMAKLADAIYTGKFDNFYAYTSPQFQKSVSLKKLESVFSKFKSLPVDWSNIKTTTPIVTKKEITDKGVLRIIGYSPLNSNKIKKIEFQLEYFKNNGKYELVGVFIKPVK